VTHSLLRFDRLVTPTFPIIFHALTGKDEREARSPSFFNTSEASLVKTYAEALLGDKRLRLTHDHIGIISPYHAQCFKIRSVLKNKLAGIKVGSVEEFQGQERRVIIISTVRSSVEYVAFDLRHHLGFVADPKRFNVAVTRAQALLIIVGDPKVLSMDPVWRRFLNYVYLKGGWTGRKIDWDPNEPVGGVAYDARRRKDGMTALEELIERTKVKIVAHIRNEDGADDSGDDGEGHIDRAWRNEFE